jgi:hypothetical protein
MLSAAANARASRSSPRARVAIALLLVLALAGCATTRLPSPGGPSAEEGSYVGVFTGELVDGKPLYRFPTIEVVGSRRSVTDGDGLPN